MKSLTLLLTLSLAFTANVSLAHDTTRGVDKRQLNQKARISQGVKSGELTRLETARLVKGQVQLQRMENRAKADGQVTTKERVQLQRKANVESRKISRNKHDGQRRGG